jgi:hypothetical protein
VSRHVIALTQVMLIWGIRLFLFFVIFNAALDILFRVAWLVKDNIVSIALFRD